MQGDQNDKIKNENFLKFHNEILEYVALVEPNVDEINQRNWLIRCVQLVISSLYPASDAAFAVYGSQYTTLALPHSDIDLGSRRLTGSGSPSVPECVCGATANPRSISEPPPIHIV